MIALCQNVDHVWRVLTARVRPSGVNVVEFVDYSRPTRLTPTLLVFSDFYAALNLVML